MDGLPVCFALQQMILATLSPPTLIWDLMACSNIGVIQLYLSEPESYAQEEEELIIEVHMEVEVSKW